MHGRKKPTRGPTDEEVAEKAKKLAKYNTLADAYRAVVSVARNSPAQCSLNV